MGLGNIPATYSSIVKRVMGGVIEWGGGITPTHNLKESDHLGKQEEYDTMILVSSSQMKASSHIQTNEEQVKINPSS